MVNKSQTQVPVSELFRSDCITVSPQQFLCKFQDSGCRPLILEQLGRWLDKEQRDGHCLLGNFES